MLETFCHTSISQTLVFIFYFNMFGLWFKLNCCKEQKDFVIL